jgi:hypothetical protein
MARMPWCPSCDRYLAPPGVHADGTCPTCGTAVDPGGARAVATDEAAPDSTADKDDELDPIPWHFKLLLGALAVYLGYRAFQGVEWLAGL